MMVLTGEDIGKKYGKTWIFKGQNFTLETGEKVAITGKNGAGKSTLLQLMAGYLTPSKGKILIDDVLIDDAQNESVIIGPYTEIIEEFTLLEFLDFHQKFKKATHPINEMADSASLPLNKRISDFSTGMKQRAKLLTAFFFENDLIFFDEPTSNLDEEGFLWWKKCLENLKDHLIIIASNEKDEIAQCEKSIDL
ncbi:ABC transporter ATP-binding protein [Ekhidna sp.]